MQFCRFVACNSPVCGKQQLNKITEARVKVAVCKASVVLNKCVKQVEVRTKVQVRCVAVLCRGSGQSCNMVETCQKDCVDWQEQEGSVLYQSSPPRM